MQNKLFDIITLNETRLDSSVLNGEIEIPGYDIVRRDRNRSGGGVAMYIRSNIPYTIRKDLFPDNLELICVEIKKFKSKSQLITTWYRPPNSSVELFSEFENFLKLLEDENKEIIITGDLNCNLLEQNKSLPTSKLVDLIDIYQLQQHIQCPTRITSTTASLLDVILTYYGDDKILDTGVIHLGISDHSLVYLCRKLSIPKAPPKTVFTRHYKNYNVNQFNNDLSEVFNLPLDSAILTDPNALWNDFKNKFLSVADKHAPIRQRRVKSEYKPWLTNEIKQMSYHRDYLKKQSIKLRSANYDKAYKRCKNKLNNLIKETKQEYFRDKLSNAKNSKESWRTINELLNKKPKTSEIKELDINGQLITDDDKIAEAFNQYFSTIGSTLSDKITDNCTDPMNFVTPLDCSIFNFTSITLQETIGALNEIKTKKSPGLDGISIRLLKDASNIVAGPLVNIFNVSLQRAIFPNDWKLAKVTPIFKEGNKADCENYRPISVISAVAKLFEKLVYLQLSSFLRLNGILVEQQSGFRQQHSTETALLSSTNEWLFNMDRGLLSGVLFLDLKKAFDTIDHHILLSKLELYGIKGTSLKWFESYVSGRSQICSVNSKMSAARQIKCGIPQGSNLGPILFLLYINDLPNCLETTKANLFADDTSLSCEGFSPYEIETKLNKDIENVHRWLTANKLSLNMEKSEFMIIGSRRRLASIENSPVLTLGGNNIKRVYQKKTLGMILDDQLKWNKHNEMQCKTISNNIALLKRAKLFVNRDSLIKIFNALVWPHFNYCSTIWNDGCCSIIDKLFILQKRAARVITGDTYEVRSMQTLDSLNWLPIEELLKQRQLIMTFKVLTGRLPRYLGKLFSVSQNDNYNLRSNQIKLNLPKPKTNFLKRSFSYRAAKSWNELPSENTENYNNLSILSFKRQLLNSSVSIHCK